MVWHASALGKMDISDKKVESLVKKSMAIMLYNSEAKATETRNAFSLGGAFLHTGSGSFT
jgi:hypothetical protein